jgi:D-alanyl-lipoteichoic acid acyltransferase DltB (MBOAT superfamily)
MGYSVPPNFNHPYAASSLQEFWQRWHISLMTWFNDYVFTPFTIAKRDWGRTAVVCGIFITFSISGLWHGAAWTFVFWGLLHATGLSFEFVTTRLRSRISKKVPAPIFKGASRIATLSFVLFTYIFFRSADFHQVHAILGGMFTPDARSVPGTWIKYMPLLCLALLPELSYWFGASVKVKIAPKVYRFAEVAGVIALLVLCVYLRGPGFQFIYFQF